MHIPVLLDRVMEFMEPLEGKRVVDGTVGAGGHAEAIAPRLGPAGKLIGLDRDASTLQAARHRLSAYRDRAVLFHANFSELQSTLEACGIGRVDRVLLDLGLSSLQLEDQNRGFSFNLEGPLDMRMDRRQQFSALDIVSRYDERKLGGLLREYGEERFAGRIAAAIVRSRKGGGLRTTLDLAGLVERVIPRKAWPRRIHPATRTFQALRIAVNGEMENLQEGLLQAAGAMLHGGRVLVISYHSLEDRLVKNFFKARVAQGWKVLTRKPVVPDEAEIRENRRARSAKLRVMEKAA